MLTWAIAWMSAQMGKEVDGLEMLLFISIIVDAGLLAFCGWAIFK